MKDRNYSGSEYYRKGYYHANVDTNVGFEFRDEVMNLIEGTFAYRDYTEGFRAARNDQWWAAHLNSK